MRIAIVEDNRPLADGLARAFEADGHGVDQLHDGEEAELFLKDEKVDLIILDINLPGQSGLDVLRSLRKSRKQTPVLLLTARDAIDDKITGLDLGADDYLTKPFDLAELKARARALLRRTEKDLGGVITLGQLKLDPEKKHISIRDEILQLPRREYALAELLIRKKEHIFSKTRILDQLYGAGTDTNDTTVELYVHRLRKRLAGSGVEIKTVRGLGYCMRVNDSNAPS